MSQLIYNYDMAVGLRGQIADIGYDNVLSYNAETNIEFGMGVVQGANEDGCTLPTTNVAVLLFDADFVASNTINLDVNGDAITPVVYASSHANTLTLLATEIDGLDDVTASVTGAREITIVGDGVAVLVENIAVTGGVSQAEGSVTTTSNATFIGMAVHTQAKEQDANGLVLYKTYDAVSVMTQGRMYVYVEQAVAVGDPVYLRIAQGGDADEKPGQFRMDADGGDAILLSRVRWIKGAAADGIATLEVNLV